MKYLLLALIILTGALSFTDIDVKVIIFMCTLMVVGYHFITDFGDKK
jgi:hypothetical protein